MASLWREWTACCAAPQDEAGGNSSVSEVQIVGRGLQPQPLEEDDNSEAAVEMPKDTAPTFKVVLERRMKTDIGLHLDITEGAHVHIAGIIERGPVWAYNRNESEEDLQIRPGDYLIGVNDTSGTPEELVKKLHQRGQDDMVLELSRAETWEVRLEKKEEDVFGLDLSVPEASEQKQKKQSLDGSVKARALVVLDVKEGLIADFNLAHPSMAIRSGDRILSVNCSAPGSSTFEEMMHFMQTSREVSFLMSRPRFLC